MPAYMTRGGQPFLTGSGVGMRTAPNVRNFHDPGVSYIALRGGTTNFRDPGAVMQQIAMARAAQQARNGLAVSAPTISPNFGLTSTPKGLTLGRRSFGLRPVASPPPASIFSLPTNTSGFMSGGRSTILSRILASEGTPVAAPAPPSTPSNFRTVSSTPYRLTNNGLFRVAI